MEFFVFTREGVRDCVLALGTFDGVHRGHTALLSIARGDARARGLAFGAVIIDRDGARICAPERRLDLIRLTGADFAFVYNLSEIHTLSCADFVGMIKSDCHARECVCGYNFRFGYGAAGDANTLSSLIETRIVPEFDIAGEAVSSTRIREKIAAGDVLAASELLGRYYEIPGKVTHGSGIGAGLGSPTANIPIPDGMCIPKYGVYVTECVFDGKAHRAVTDIGVRPTFGDTGETRCECYIPGFSGNLYEKDIILRLTEFIRPEMKFESAQKLRERIERDTEYALSRKY